MKNHALEKLRRELFILCDKLDCLPQEIIEKDRSQSVARCRQAIVSHLRIRTGASYPELGTLLCRDHTTIIAADRRFKRAVETGKEWALQLDNLLRPTLSKPVAKLVKCVIEGQFETAVAEAV